MKRAYPTVSVKQLEEEGSIVEIQDGNHGERHPKVNDYVDDGVPFVMANNIRSGFVDLDSCSRISEEQARGLRIGFSTVGDVLLSHKGTLGNVALVTTADPYLVLTPQVTYYRTNSAKLLPRFLVQAFRDPSFQARLRSGGDQGTRPYVGITAQRRLEITYPPFGTQQRIADILAAYDDLIENNRRRMALLEDAARQVYREWFARLRFPGHEHTPVTDGVPVGWEKVPTPDAIDINPPSHLSDDDEHWFVEMSDLPTNSMVIQDAVKRDGRSGSKFRNGDTLLARITPCLENGKTAFVDFMADDEVGRGSTEFIVLRAKRLTPEHVYCLARTYDFREHAIKSMVGASGRQRVKESCFDKFLVLLPPPALQSFFTASVRPLFQQVKVLHAQSQKLRAARDLLLPRLMSGEISA